MNTNTPELRQRLRNILLSVWDPLCVGDNPNLADEYDRYLPALLELLQQNGDEAALAKALERIETEELGMQSPSAGIRKAAAEIHRLTRNRPAIPGDHVA